MAASSRFTVLDHPGASASPADRRRL